MKSLPRPPSGYFSGEGIDRNQPLDLFDLLDFATRPAWQRDARCKEFPDVDFYPPKGADLEPARQVCAGCAVAQECGEYAIANHDWHGIWGGLSGRERRRARSAASAA